MFLYKISFKNNLTDMVYIGITRKSPEFRFAQHLRDDCNSLISRAIRQYGKENTVFSIIAEYKTEQELANAEKEYIKKFNSLYPTGFNLTEGGLGFGKKRTPINKKVKRKDILEKYYKGKWHKYHNEELPESLRSQLFKIKISGRLIPGTVNWINTKCDDSGLLLKGFGVSTLSALEEDRRECSGFIYASHYYLFEGVDYFREASHEEIEEGKLKKLNGRWVIEPYYDTNEEIDYIRKGIGLFNLGSHL